MLTLTSAQNTALAQRRTMRRDFIWVEAVDPVTGDPTPIGFWNDVGTVELDGREYIGSGSVISISTLSASSSLNIPGITITMSGINDEVVNVVRGYDLAQTPITVSIGIFDVADKQIIPPLVQMFVGVIDSIDILTPRAGEKSTITFHCESASRALTIRGTNTRSASTHRGRFVNDAFYDYTAAMSQLSLHFGRK